MEGNTLNLQHTKGYSQYKEKIKISIIISAYNEGKLPRRCLMSVLSQTYKDLEIIVIDDGSTDDTAEILDAFAMKDTRIVAVHQANVGLVEVREKGISLATGDFIGFVDGDDTIQPDMYERLLDNALKYNADISHCGMLYCFADGRRKPMRGLGTLCIMDNIEGQIQLLKGTVFEPSLCNKLYSAKLLRNSCLDKSITNNEDLLRNFVLFKRAKSSVYEDFCGYLYWRRENSMSNNNRQIEIWNDILEARRLIVENSADGVREAAESSWILALIAAYNSLLGLEDETSSHMRCVYRKQLMDNKEYFSHLDRKYVYLAELIIRAPAIYFVMQRVHQVIVRYRIKQSARKASRK